MLTCTRPGRGSRQPIDPVKEDRLIEPVASSGVLITSFSSALVIASGALYILLFTISHLRKKPGMLILAYACFAVLVANVLVLATLLFLDGYQLAQVLGILLGYLLVPHVIRRLVAGPAGEKPDSRAASCTLLPAK